MAPQRQYDIIMSKLESIEKQIKRDRQERMKENVEDARNLLCEHLECLKYSIDDEFEEPNSPRDLDRDDPKDKKTMSMMIKLIDSFIDSINGEDDTSGSEEDEEQEEDEEEDDDDDNEYHIENAMGDDDGKIK